MVRKVVCDASTAAEKSPTTAADVPKTSAPSLKLSKKPESSSSSDEAEIRSGDADPMEVEDPVAAPAASTLAPPTSASESATPSRRSARLQVKQEKKGDADHPAAGDVTSTSSTSTSAKSKYTFDVMLSDRALEQRFAANDIIVIRPDSETTSEPFWLAISNDDVLRGTTDVRISWLERDQSSSSADTEVFIEGENDWVAATTIVGKAKLEYRVEDGKWLLSSSTKQQVLQMLASDSANTAMESAHDSDQSGSESDRTSRRRRSAKKRAPRKRKASQITKGSTSDDDSDQSAAAAATDGGDDDSDGGSAKRKPRRSAKKRARTDTPRRSTSRTPKKSARTPSRGRGKKANVPSKAEMRPHIQVPENDPIFEASRATPSAAASAGPEGVVQVDTEAAFRCCTLCGSRELIRAIIAGDTSEVQKLFNDTTHVCSITTPRSVDVHLTPIMYAVKTGNLAVLQMLMKEIETPSKRAPPPRSRLNTASTGTYSIYTRGHAMRPIHATRGGKEGNNAFTADNHHYMPYPYLNYHELPSLVVLTPNISKDILQWLIMECNMNALYSSIYLAVEAGERENAAKLIDLAASRGGWGFNFLHKQALTLSGMANFDKFRKISVTKKPLDNCGITPIHCAAINPDPRYLKELLEVCADYTRPDDRGRKPMHYAAACKGEGPLRFLLERGLDFNEGDSAGITPLMIAARYGRVHNIRLLLEADKKAKEKEQGRAAAETTPSTDPSEDIDALDLVSIVDHEDQQGNTALHYAVENGHADAVLALLEYSATVDKLTKADKKSPLTVGAQYGHLASVRALVDAGHAMVDIRDKLGRTPLIHAVKNGHLHVVLYLLKNGADSMAVDTSKNSVVHYAAAYGWRAVLEVLIAPNGGGADPNVVNDWRESPLGIAMAKGHLGCAELLLSQAGVNVDVRDDNGRTLVAKALVEEPANETTLQVVKFLVERKNANVNIADLDGNTPLHHIAKFAHVLREDEKNNLTKEDVGNLQAAKAAKRPFGKDKKDIDKHAREEEMKDVEEDEEGEQDEEEVDDEGDNSTAMRPMDVDEDDHVEPLEPIDYDVELVKLLLSRGADVNAANKHGQTPLMVAMESFNVQLILLLLDAGAAIHGVRSVDGLAGHTAEPEPVMPVRRGRRRFGLTAGVPNETASATQRVGGQNILHMLAQQCMHDQWDVAAILQRIIDHPQFRELGLANAFDDEGYTPVHRLLQTYLTYTGPNPSLLVRNSWEAPNPNKLAARHRRICHRALEMLRMLADASKSRVAIDFFASVAMLKDYRDTADGAAAMETSNAVGSDDDDDVIVMADVMHMDVSHLTAQGKRHSANEARKERDLYGPYGKSNVFHLIAVHGKRSSAFTENGPAIESTNQIVDLLLSLPGAANAMLSQNLNGETPLHFAIRCNVVDYAMQLLDSPLFVADHFARVDKRHYNLLHAVIEYTNGHMAILERLLAKPGVEVALSSVDKVYHNTALHCAAYKRLPEAAEKLLAKGASVNAQNKHGRTPLHLAVHSSTSTVDASTEIEELLLGNGAQINTMDHLHRTPLHYCFVKAQRKFFREKITYNDLTFVGDPIETLSCLYVRATGVVNVDTVDVFGRTPLHYASLRGATLCSLYLLARGAKLDAEDIDHNTPLGLAFLGSHADYAIMLIQKGACVTHQLRLVTWADPVDQLESGSAVAVPATSIGGFVKSARSARGRTKQTVRKGKQFKMAAPWQPDSDEDEDVGTPKKADGEEDDEASKQNQEEEARINRLVKKTTEVSLFERAIQLSWQGVAFLLLDSGFDYLEAMRVSMSTGRFQLVMTLLGKTKDDAIVQKCDSLGNNLMHAFARYSSGLGSNEKLATTIPQRLISRGVRIDQSDADGCLPLHYAAGSHIESLVKFLIQQLPTTPTKRAAAADVATPIANYVDIADKKGCTPLVWALKGANMQNISQKTLLETLFHAGANPNVVYPETKYDNQRTTLLIHAVRCMRSDIVDMLLSAGASVNARDERGRTALMYAAANGDMGLVKALLANRPNSSAETIDVNATDNEGKTVVHFVVSPFDDFAASFENTEMLQLLAKKKANLNVTDKHGRTPLYYAHLQEDGVMARALEALGAKLEPNKPQRLGSVILDWPFPTVDAAADAREFVARAIEAIQRRRQAKNTEPKPPPVDENLDIPPGSGHVLVDGDNTYDVTLTKVDVSHGLYGMNNFYRMQVVHQPAKDLYILFTRWGRIGDNGQFQRTPFSNKDEAVTEFCKIFRAKTGNLWDQRSAFVKKHKKYRLITFDAQRDKPHPAHLLSRPLDMTRSRVACALEGRVQTLLDEITDVATLNEAMRVAGVDTDAMPLSALSRETLDQALAILGRLRTAVERAESLHHGTAAATAAANGDEPVNMLDEMQKAYEEAAAISNEFYELIPHSNFRAERIPPLTSLTEVKSKVDMITALLDLHAAARILLAARLRISEIHPLDYTYRALGVTMETLAPHSTERELIERYIDNTGGSSSSVINVFRIQRRGEAVAFAAHKHLKNHYLLWHGSPVSNFLGILSQGLRVAPPEAPASGYAFGKGVYFADMFQKSRGYARPGHTSALLLLCEVALGEMYECTPTYMEHAPPGYNSTKGQGMQGPDWSKTLVLAGGAAMPLGPTVNYAELAHKAGKDTTGWLAYNEYIVYNPTQIRMRYLVQVTA